MSLQRMARLYCLPVANLCTPAILMLLVTLTLTASVSASDKQNFNIPAGPLGRALSEFAASASLLLSFDSSLTEGKTTPGLEGNYTVTEGFQKLLENSGLEAYQKSDGNYLIRQKNTKDNSGTDPGNDKTTISPSNLDTMTVEGVAETGYETRVATTATKTETPIFETPVSVQIVPSQVFEDQAAQGLEDVYINVSGVVESGNTLNAQSEVLPVIRGFEAPFVFRNGLRATQVGAVDLVNIESVEVLKGPASILFGALEPGGIVNYTTKKPLKTRFHAINQEFGSYDHYRTTVDTTGPLNKDASILYRLNAAYTNSGSFRDNVDLERVAIAPTLTWLISDRTELTFDLSYTREEVPYDSGVPFGLDGEPIVPIDTFFGDPSLDGRTLEDTFVGYSLKHRFNNIFKLRNRFQFHRATPENESIRHRGVTGTAGNEMLRARYQNEERTDDEYQLVTDLLANFSTGPIGHEALIGIDLIKQESEFDRFRQNLSSILITDDAAFNFTPPADLTLEPAFRDSLEWAAVYFQDQMSMLDGGRLKLLLGGRFDYVEQEDKLEDSSIRDTEFTGRAGVLYELTEQFSPYASISQSFRPQTPTTRDRSGSLLDPETGIQYEAGLKFQSLNERLLATLAVYQIEKEDVAVFDSDFFNNTGEFAFFPGVDQRSRGVELDITGRISDGLKLFGNYAYTETEVLKNEGDPSMVGQSLGNVPEHTARLWLAYDFRPGSRLENFGIGGGVRYEDRRFAQFDNTLTLDSFVIFDAAVWYEHILPGGQALKARLNFKNITDEEYYTRASDRSIVHPGAPFTVLGSIGIEF